MKVNLDMHFNFQAINKTLQLLFDVEVLLRLHKNWWILSIFSKMVNFLQKMQKLTKCSKYENKNI